MRTIQPHKMSDFLSSYFNIAWENSRNLATLPLISTRNDVLTTTHTIPYWWRISITTQTWVVIRMEFLRSFLRRKKNGKQVVTSRRFPLRLISTEHFMFYRMHLLTVAGEATARSWTSNNMCMVLFNLILSLLARQSILLSSKTVFMFSIHRASTGPSHTIHLWSSVVSCGETVKNGQMEFKQRCFGATNVNRK